MTGSHGQHRTDGFFPHHASAGLLPGGLQHIGDLPHCQLYAGYAFLQRHFSHGNLRLFCYKRQRNLGGGSANFIIYAPSETTLSLFYSSPVRATDGIFQHVHRQTQPNGLTGMRGERGKAPEALPSAGSRSCAQPPHQPERKACACSCLPGSFAVRPQWSLVEPRQAVRNIRRYGRVGASSDPSGCAVF